jgi:hypothetical protein
VSCHAHHSSSPPGQRPSELSRVFAFTHLNAHSSRSHAVVMLQARRGGGWRSARSQEEGVQGSLGLATRGHLIRTSDRVQCGCAHVPAGGAVAQAVERPGEGHGQGGGARRGGPEGASASGLVLSLLWPPAYPARSSPSSPRPYALLLPLGFTLLLPMRESRKTPSPASLQSGFASSPHRPSFGGARYLPVHRSRSGGCTWWTWRAASV